MDSFLEQLAGRVRVPDADVISADEVADWPEGKLDELVLAGIIREIPPATGVVCDECENNCYVEPNIRTNPETDEATGVFVCTRNPDIGRIEVDVERFRRWGVNKKKLSRLGYGPKTKGNTQKQTREQKRQDVVFLLQAALLEHHKVGTDDFNETPITQERLHKKLEWSQSKVSRVMTRLFGDNAMEKYKRNCRTDMIGGFLRKLESGGYEVEAIAKPIETSD